MNYNLVALDPSLISTGLVINGKVFNYCRESDAVNKKGFSKWFDLCKNNITYKYIDLSVSGDYSETEMNKLKLYYKITNDIILTIKDNIDNTLKTKIAIEGYSYSSAAGPLIDLVTFSTLLRSKLLNITDDITILSPSTLKLESCKLTYKPIEKIIGGKKPRTELLYKNNIGIAGGSFTKTEMFEALIENDNFNDDYCTFLKSNKEVILASSKIPKPLEDTNDSYLLYLYLKSISN